MHLLETIVNKRLEDFTCWDYTVIFKRFLPASNYSEGLYYIYPCLNYICGGKVVHDTRYVDSILWWIYHFEKNLRIDGLWDDIIAKILSTLKKLSNEFELFDLSEDECKRLGRDFNYSIGPYNQLTMHEFIDDLTIWGLYDSILNDYLNDLSLLDSLSKARWYVELASHSRVWCLLYEENCQLQNYENKERLFHRLHSFKILQKAEGIAREATWAEDKIKYNKLVTL